MTKFYYIVKGATKGDNVGEYEAEDKETCLAELNEAYGSKTHGLKVEIITKAQHASEGKRILKAKLAEVETPEKGNE